MGSYRLTNKAVEDLARIWNYTVDTWSEKTIRILHGKMDLRRRIRE